MHTFSPPYSSAVSYLHRRSEPTFRGVPTRITVKYGYGFESSSFLHGIGSTRTDWQSACAILSSKVDSQNDDSNVAAAGENIAVVNGHKSAVTDLNLVPSGAKKRFLQNRSRSPTYHQHRCTARSCAWHTRRSSGPTVTL
ncbi:hypothetical protein AHAS_Ahas16G0005700 [Arachis hypogaea]